MSVAWVAAGVAAVGAAASVDQQRKAANQARDAQTGAAGDANTLAQDQFERSRQDAEPWRLAGQGALGAAQTQLGTAEWTRPFGLDQFQADPGYQFRLNEGSKALERRASAGGKFFSGGALKDASRFNQDSASQEYGAAFNRFQTDRQNRLNPLLSMAGLGQSANSQTAQLGQANAMYQGGNLVNAGDATAAASVARGNSQGGMMNNLYGAVRGFQNNYQRQSNPMMDNWGASTYSQPANYNYNEQDYL